MRTTQGFTLIECLIALAVLAILLAAASPSMREMKTRNELQSMQHALLSSAQAARGFAVARKEQVSLCASANGLSCDGGANWSHGWLLYAERNRNSRFDGSDELLQVQQNASPVEISASRVNLNYRADGSASGSNLTIKLCVPGRSSGHAVVVANSGRIRAEEMRCS